MSTLVKLVSKKVRAVDFIASCKSCDIPPTVLTCWFMSSADLTVCTFGVFCHIHTIACVRTSLLKCGILFFICVSFLHC